LKFFCRGFRTTQQSGENNFRDAAECLANAQELGASQRQSAKAVGKSPAWVNALLKWRRSGYKDHCPFPRLGRHVQPAEQRKASRPPTSAEQAQAQVARASAERAKAEAQTAKAEAVKAQAEFQRSRAEAASRMFGAETKRIPHSGAREQLINALQMLASERAPERASAALIVEKQRALLDMAWDELIVPAELQRRKAA